MPRMHIHHCITQLTHSDACRGSGRAGGRQQLEGLVLRSQLLVLLQSRAVCDARGQPLQPSAEGLDHAGADGHRRASLDARMRAFFTRPRFRYRCGPACQLQTKQERGT